MTKLRLWREEHGWSQGRAAAELGISRASYVPLERGLQNPSPGMVVALERLFGDQGREMLREIKVRNLPATGRTAAS